MKILKFSGIVLGVHLLALIIIFTNQGCSSSTKAPPPAGDTITAAEPPPTITVPGTSGSSDSGTPPPISFNSDSAAINAGVRYSPTRPGTPAASSLQAEPVSNVTPATTYTVVKNDSLWTIAHKNHLTIAELAAANNLSEKAKLQLGQKLIIPAKGVPASAAASAPATSGLTTAASQPAAANTATKTGNEALTHTVRPGETLGTIARRYGVKQGEIAVANNISDPQKIRAGVILVIPGWDQTSGKAAKAQKAPTPDAAAATSTPPSSYGYEAPKAQPPAPEVPVIQVEEAPAPKSP